MSRYFDGFIEQQRLKGVPVSPELIQGNQQLKDKDEAKRRYANRDFWCRIGLHSRVQAWYGGGYPLTCVKCWRHLL